VLSILHVVVSSNGLDIDAANGTPNLLSYLCRPSFGQAFMKRIAAVRH
jgi:hypothetical protein